MVGRVCHWIRGIVLCAAVTPGLSTTAAAAPITYVEVTDGELTGQNIGVFDEGANVVTATEQALNQVEFDRFHFTIAPGFQLDGIILTAIAGSNSFTLAPPGEITQADRFGVLFLTSSSVGIDFLPALLASDPGKTATAPLPGGTYQVALATLVGTSVSTYTFNVSQGRCLNRCPCCCSASARRPPSDVGDDARTNGDRVREGGMAQQAVWREPCSTVVTW